MEVMEYFLEVVGMFLGVQGHDVEIVVIVGTVVGWMKEVVLVDVVVEIDVIVFAVVTAAVVVVLSAALLVVVASDVVEAAVVVVLVVVQELVAEVNASVVVGFEQVI
jgi:hypothetical protein